MPGSNSLWRPCTRPLFQIHEQEFVKLKLEASNSLLISTLDTDSVKHASILEKEMNLCMNEGNCDKLSKTCHCNKSWEGDLCQLDIDECRNDVEICHNGGNCNNTQGSFECDCKGTGYNGRTCDDDVNECLERPCLNGGICSNINGTFTCNCTETGFTGAICEIDTCTQKSGVYFQN